MNLILLEPDEAGERVVLADHRAVHLRRVLQVIAGQQVRVGILDGPLGIGTVVAVDAGHVELACAFGPDVPPRPPLDLLLALPRPKVLRRLWAQVAALGVGRVILTNAGRVERDYFGSHAVQPVSYRPLLVEGLQQARDTRLPTVTIHRRFRVLVEDELDALCPHEVRLVADPAASATIDDALDGENGARVLIAVGPEGGWNPFELDLLEQHEFRRVALGRRTLRCDTACVAVLAVARNAMERLLHVPRHADATRNPT